jgi:hypothetical protein
VRTLRHWWNGATGDSAAEVVRRDVYLRTDGRRWEVEATEGAIGEHSARARSTRRTYSDEAEAQRVLDEWLGDRSGWQEVPPDPG